MMLLSVTMKRSSGCVVSLIRSRIVCAKLRNVVRAGEFWPLVAR